MVRGHFTFSVCKRKGHSTLIVIIAGNKEDAVHTYRVSHRGAQSSLARTRIGQKIEFHAA